MDSALKTRVKDILHIHCRLVLREGSSKVNSDSLAQLALRVIESLTESLSSGRFQSL